MTSISSGIFSISPPQSHNFHGHNLDLLFSQIAPFVTSVIQTSHTGTTTSSIQIICSSASTASFLASSGFSDNGSLHILPVSQLLLPIPSASRVECRARNLNHPFVDTLKPFTTYQPICKPEWTQLISFSFSNCLNPLWRNHAIKTFSHSEFTFIMNWFLGSAWEFYYVL